MSIVAYKAFGCHGICRGRDVQRRVGGERKCRVQDALPRQERVKNDRPRPAKQALRLSLQASMGACVVRLQLLPQPHSPDSPALGPLIG